MISTITRRFTKRFEGVNVTTVSSLRERLEEISTAACKLEIEKVTNDRVIVCAKATGQKRPYPAVILPAYPTGHADDHPGNPNVVLDPVEFTNAATHDERHLFVPLLGHDILEHYEKLHPAAVLPFNRCC